MNILFVHEVDWQKKVVYDVHLLAEAMSKRGHKVYAIDYSEVVKPKIQISKRVINGACVRLVHPWHAKTMGLNRLTAFVSHFGMIGGLIIKRNIDAIILYSVPTNGLQVLYWADKFGIPVYFRSLDILHKLVHYPALSFMTKKMEAFVYKNVDRVLTITPRLSEYVIKLGAHRSKVSFLPMTVDTKLFCPMSKNLELMARWGIRDGDSVVLFMGTLFNFSGLDGIIRNFGHVLKIVPSAKFMIVGDGEQRKCLENLIDEYGLRNKVIITGFQSYQDMPSYINISDVCINPFISNDITKDIFPGKIVQYLACAKSVIMRPLDGVKAVIEGTEQGVVYAKDDMAITASLVCLLQSKQPREALGANGMGYARQVHDCIKVATKLENIIGEL